MNETLTKILNFCEQEVDNGSIYAWAASGQKGTSVTEAWIRGKEARNNGGANADRAVRMWKKRMAAGNKLFKVFDCSGYVSAALVAGGVFKGRRDCDGLWSLCDRLAKPVNGALLFRVSSSNSEDETHVGLYFNGYQYHAKGRDDGVVKEPYKASYWAKIGWFKAIQKDAETETSEPVISDSTVKPPYVLVLGKTVNVRNGSGVEYDKTGMAHRGDKFPYQGTDESDAQWYMIEFEDMTAFISSNPKYTKLVLK